MAKKSKQPTQKSGKKSLLKNIENKLAEAVKDFHKKISDKKLEKKIHKAGKILSKSLTMKQIKVVHKEKVENSKKEKKVQEREKEVAS